MYNRKRLSESLTRLGIEPLETRRLLSFGTPNWIEQGPGLITGGQVEGILVPVDRPVAGAVETIAAHPTDPNEVVVGSINGGIWKTTNATSAAPSWTPLTDHLSSLSISSLAYSPVDDDVLYAGTGSFSSGASAGGRGIGVLKSTDAGATWSKVGGTIIEGAAGRRIRSVVPTTLDGGQVILVGAIGGGGVFRSADGGNSFTQLSGNGASGLPASLDATSVVADPADPLRFYAAIGINAAGQGIFRSTDGGLTWQATNTGITGLGGAAGRIELAVHYNSAASTHAIYVAVIANVDGRLSGVFRSASQGNTWTPMDVPVTNEGGTEIGIHPGEKPISLDDPGGQGRIHFSILADRTDPNVVYVGGDRQPGAFPNSIGAANFSGRLFRGDASLPVGSQWAHLTHSNALGAPGGGTANNSAPHADSRDMAFDANGDVLEADDGGLYRRTNPVSDTGVWQSVNGNLRVTEFYSVAYDSLNNTLTGGTQDVGSPRQTLSGGQSWATTNQGDGGVANVDTISSPGNAIHYNSSQNLGSFRRRTYDGSNLLLSTVTPTTIVNTTGLSLQASDPNLQFVQPWVLNAVDPTRLLFGTRDLYESFDRADHLTFLGGAVGTSAVGGMAYGGKLNGLPNPDVIYAGMGSTLKQRTTAGGPLATLVAYVGSVIRDIALDPDNWMRAYILDTAGQIFRTLDGGATFNNITNTLSALVTDVRAIEVFGATADPGDEAVFVTGLGGVYGTTDPATFASTWVEFGVGLPNALGRDLRYDATDDVLVVGTFGRGAWLVQNLSTFVQPGGGPANPLVVQTTNDSGTGSLRHAILNANANAGTDTILFNIPATDPNFVDVDGAVPGGDAAADVYVISPLSALPALTDAAIVDGRAQTAFAGDTNSLGPEIVLRGANAGASTGLQLNANGNVVAGLVIQSFGAHGIAINGTSNNWIHGNYIGADATGTLAGGNAQEGVLVSGGALNRIGTNGDGTDDDAERNVISGNTSNGVLINGQILNLVIADRVISAASSTSVATTIAQADLMDGATGAAGNWTINNPIPGGGGDDYAVRGSGTLMVNTAGTYSFASSTDDGSRLRIDGSDIIIASAPQAFIDRFGQVALAAGTHAFEWVGFERGGGAGFELSVAVGANELAVTAANGWRVVGDNSLPGNAIQLQGTIALTAFYAAPQNTVAGNYIGADRTGSVPLGNLLDGIRISNSALDVLGTDSDGSAGDAAEGNLISGNVQRGVRLQTARRTIIAGNFIGANANGTAAVPNTLDGILLFSGSQFIRVGTDGDGVNDAGERNIISGNLSNGLNIQGAGTDNNIVAGNYIGTNALGSAPIANAVGIIIFAAAKNNRVGANGDGIHDAAEGNVISGNTQTGVRITGSGSTGNVVAGNRIGVNASGDVALANGGSGVLIDGGAVNNRIGGAAVGESNTVAFNAGSGVAVTGAASAGNSIRVNAIYQNGGLGIDLGNTGVTANDLGDSDAGANSLQNFPVLTAALMISGSTAQISGTLNSAPNAQFTVELFASPDADPSGNGEGKVFLGARTLMTGADGNGSFADIFSGDFTANGFITATATDAAGNSSEFSLALQVTQSPSLIFTVTNTNDSGLGSFRQAILNANAHSGLDTIVFNIPATDANFVDVDAALPGGDAAPDVYVIAPLSALDALIDGAIIDGRSQNSFGGDTNAFGPEIVLDGNGLAADGLAVLADDSAVHGLNIQRFGLRGLNIEDATNVAVAGNFIGVNATGSSAAANSGSGVRVANAANVALGGASPAERNLISGNGGEGILIVGSGSIGNAVVGNRIGTNAAGTFAIANGGEGIEITGAANNYIGSNGDGVNDDAEGNVISGNASYGILIFDNGSTGNVVAGNLIGTNAAGDAAIGNGFVGVLINGGAANNRVGTNGDAVNDAAERNLISGNSARGVQISDAGSDNNLVAGNIIQNNGLGASPSGPGVLIQSGAKNNLIGGAAPGTGNLIVLNSGSGVAVIDPDSTGNAVRGNAIYDNGGLGIDLEFDGVTPSDLDDPDAGPNNLQNFPVLSAISIVGNTLSVTGSLNSAPNAPYTIEFFAGTDGDPSGHGEGEVFLGQTTVITGADGIALFDEALSGDFTTRRFITATATDAAGNTSEFSRALHNVNAVLDNSQAGFSTTGDWAPGGGPGVGRLNNVYVAFGEPGQIDVATWNFNLSSPGRYRISATWFTNPGFPQLFTATAPFTVTDAATGVARGTALVNQKVFPDDFSDAGSAWEDLGVFDITGSSLAVELRSTSDNATYVVADAIRVERVGDLSSAAEVQVTESGFDVPDGAGNVSFGSAELNTPTEKTFIISNSGAQPLTLAGTVTVTPGSGFTVLTQPGLTTLDPGESTMYSVRMEATLPGLKTGTVSFGSDDSNESPFDFSVSGTVLPTRIVDDLDPGYSNQNIWGALAGPGYNHLYHFSRFFTDADISTWMFDVTPGQYRISATWFAGRPFFDSTAPFTVFDGAVSRGGKDLNQQNLPNDREFAGAIWEDVGVFNILGNTLAVQLKGDDPVNFVIADAILIERLGDVPAGPEVTVLDGDRDVNAGTVSFGTVELNHPATKTFTITNSGTSALAITGPITVPLGYQLDSGPGLTTLDPGLTTTFTVRLTAAFDGVKAGQVTVPTNDADENPLTFNITATVLATQILDDGRPGFNFTGDFQSATVAIARDRDVSYVHFQAAPSEATWTFTVTPGLYLAAATWFDTAGIVAFASNAPFSIFDNDSPLGTFPLNQRQAPDDLNVDGSVWELFGGVLNIASTTLRVRVTNVGADGYVLADAIRLFRVGPPGNAESSGDGGLSAVGDPSRLLPRDDAAFPAAQAARRPMMATVYWTDELDELATLLAEDVTRQAGELSAELATSRRISELDDEAFEPIVSDWLSI